MRTIITYGTFDLFHKGHYNILKRAKEQGDYLIVGVTSESYDIERGKLNVRDDLLTRVKNVEATGFADKIILEEYQGQKINDIIKYSVDTLVIGSDWIGKFDYLKEYCEVLYLDRTKDISSTQLREDSGSILRIGVVTDDANDSGLVSEARYVSGLHIEGVFAPELEVAEEFKKEFELAFATDDYDALLNKSDLIYIKTGLGTRYDQAEKALAAGKPVIIEPPISLDEIKTRQLQELAARKGVAIIERITIAYLRAFTQLVWYLHGGIIGDVLALKSVLDIGECEPTFLEAQIVSLFAVRKLFGGQDSPAIKNVFRWNEENISYFSGIFEQRSARGALASVEITEGLGMESGLTIFGTKGRLNVPGNWFNIGYFQIIPVDPQASIQHYSFNFEGNGFRYLLQELLIMISNGRTESTRYFNEDSLEGIRLLADLQRGASA